MIVPKLGFYSVFIHLGLLSSGSSISSMPLAAQLAVNVTLAQTTARDTVWTIERGVYTGATVRLTLEAAAPSRSRTEHFWRLVSSDGDAGVVGWRVTRYPIPVAFRHARHSAEVSPADSSAFWMVLDEMSVELGMALFRPATIASPADPEDVIVVDLRPIGRDDGLSRGSWSSSGELFDVRVTFRDAAVLRDRHTVLHEMMHALGFGHTTQWASVVNPGDASRPARLTPEDVAYTELAMRLRELRDHADMRHLIALAAERESSRFEKTGDAASCGPDDATDSRDVALPRSRASMPVGWLTLVQSCGEDGRH